MSHNTFTVKCEQELLNCYYLLKYDKGASYMMDLMDYENDPGICRYQAVFHKNLINPRGNEKNQKPEANKKTLNPQTQNGKLNLCYPRLIAQALKLLSKQQS